MGKWRRRLSVAAVLAAVYLAVSAAPAAAANVAIVASPSTASELSSGSTTNAEVERSGDAGVVEADSEASSALRRYPMDAGSGTTIYDHATGSNADRGGAAWTSGLRERGLSFDGGDKVELNDTPLSDSTFTISTWVKIEGDPGGSYHGIVSGLSGANWYPRLMVSDTGRPQFSYQSSDGSHTISGAEGVIPTDEWVHLAVTKGPAGTRLYLNGDQFETNASMDHAITTGSNSAFLGVGAASADTYYLNGRLDEVRLYDDVLTEGQVARLATYPTTKLSERHVERFAFDGSLTDEPAKGDESGAATTTQISSRRPGVFEDAAGFSRADGDSVTFPHSASDLSGSKRWAVAAWVKPESGADGTVARALDLGNYEVQFGHTPSNNWRFYWQSSSTGYDQRIDAAGKLGEWTHLAMVRTVTDGGDEVTRYYVDGNLVQTKFGTTGTVIDSPGTNAIASEEGSVGNPEFFDGQIDEVRIYNQSLTSDQVSWMYQHPGAQVRENSTHTQSIATDRSVGGETDLELRNARATVTWQDSNGDILSQTTVSASGTVEQTWPEEPDSVEAEVSIEPTAPDYQARIDAFRVSAQTSPPTLLESTADPNNETQSEQTLEIDVRDRDFGAGHGDEVTVTFYDASDGSVIGSDTRLTNGTASVMWSDVSTGEKQWYAKATDTYGGESPETSRFTWIIAGELKIYNETRPNQLIDDQDVEITVRFYQKGSTEVVQRTATNGTVDLSGLPADERFIVTVKADSSQLTYRRIVLDSVLETSRVYLLNESVPHANVTFILDDSTGEFSGETTTLYVEKALNVSGDTQYEVIAGDEFGAAGEFPVVLQTDERYRLRVENEEGDIKRLGPFTVDEDTRVPLAITKVAVGDDTEQTDVAFGSRLEQTDSGPAIRLKYADPTNSTAALQVEVTLANGTVVRPNTTTSVSGGTYTETVAVSSMDESYTVRWYATRSDAAAAGGSEKLGTIPPLVERFGTVVPEELFTLGAWVVIIGGTGMVVIVDQRLSAVVAPILAGSMVVLGAVDIPAFFLSLALGVGIITRIGEVGP